MFCNVAEMVLHLPQHKGKRFLQICKGADVFFRERQIFFFFFRRAISPGNTFTYFSGIVHLR